MSTQESEPVINVHDLYEWLRSYTRVDNIESHTFFVSEILAALTAQGVKENKMVIVDACVTQGILAKEGTIYRTTEKGRALAGDDKPQSSE